MLRTRSLLALLAVLLLAGAGFYALRPAQALRRTGLVLGCKHAPKTDADAPKADADAGHSKSAAAAYFSGPADRGCETGVESFGDLARANSSLMSRDTAPGTALKPGAYRAAVTAKAAMAVVGGTWQPYGKAPLIADNADYGGKEGFADISGRATAFARNPNTGATYVTASNGGVWESTDAGKSWHSIGDSLPTQVVSGIDWSPANGGTLIVLTGDNAYGGDTYAGLGVYRTTDDGQTWQHSTGVPDGLLGFKVAVDPNDGNKVYAATGGGLFRSTDGGATFQNVNLPTGTGVSAPTPDCTGKAPTVKDCFLANMVTDVVVQGPANAQTTGANAKPGAVLASVGWRAGQKANADGSMQSPNNGFYESDTGDPGTFTKLDIVGNQRPNGGDALTQPRLGRIAMGIANGPSQDHRIVYALVQDAVKFNGGVSGLDANEPKSGAPQAEYLNGIWASTDFGKTWNEIEGSNEIDNDPSSNSVFAPPICRSPTPYTNYCPGIQAWYNLWISPDPTRQTSAGVPTRLAFGLEELWSNDPSATPPSGLDGSAPAKFKVIGRYAAGSTCVWPVSSGAPVCPIAEGGTTPPTTTHPDQHGGFWVPDGSGGVTLFAGNDGGVYTQHTDSSSDLSQAGWGRGANIGLYTLQPYDAEMAKDGTVYMGLQDNAEGKILPDGTMIDTASGDGFFTAVDPDHSNTAYEEYTGGAMSATTDGGKNWSSINPSLTSPLFATPFQMDPNDANHLIIAGRDVEEETAGPSGTWTKVYDLGTQKKPGDANAGSDPTTDDGPDNQQSAIDLATVSSPQDAPSGPKTPDFKYTVSSSTYPAVGYEFSGQSAAATPGSYDDHPFTIGPKDGDAAIHINMSWASAQDDWDLYLEKENSDGTETEVGSSHNSQGPDTGGLITGNAPPTESITLSNPQPGNYVIRAVNGLANPSDTPTVATTFDQRQPGAKLESDAAYVGFCGYCDTITQGTPFANGVATNVGGDKPGAPLKPDGWHIAAAKGLPSRYITSIRMDPQNPSTVYVTEAGYGRRWAFPGAVGEDTSKIGTGHVFKSIDAGQSFFDVSGDLPDVPSNWSVIHNGHLVVGTDIGVFESCDTSGGQYSRLGNGLPAAPISTLRLKPGDPDTLVAATYGRGVYTYHFDSDNLTCPPKPQQAVLAVQAAAVKACSAQRAFASTSVKPHGAGLRLAAPRHTPPIRYTAFVFKQAFGGRVRAPRPVALFSGKRAPFVWNGKPNIRGRTVTDGYYFVRFGLKIGSLGDVDRVALVRKNGRWHLLRDFDYHSACQIVRSFKLSGPTFGGSRQTPLGISFRLSLPGGAPVKVVVTRGKKVVARSTIKKPGTGNHTIKLPARRFRPGDYRVTLTAKLGKRTQRLTLGSRKI